MKKLVMTMALGLALPSTASATQADGGSITAARAIVGAMHIERTLDTMFDQMMPLVVGNTLTAIDKAPDTSDAIKTRIATTEGHREASRILGEELMHSFRSRYPAIEAATAEEYAKTFSDSELKAILAFYSSPAGAKMLAAQPQLQKTLSEAGRGIGRDAAMEAIPKAMARVDADASTHTGK